MRTRGNRAVFFIVGIVFIALGLYVSQWIMIICGIVVVGFGIASLFLPHRPR